LRFGLFAATPTLIQAQFDFLHQTQANIARNLWRDALSRGFAGIGRWSVTGCPCRVLQTFDVGWREFRPVDIERDLCSACR
jgi:hypothetical protein